MFFKQRIAPDATLSYLYGCGGKGKAVAVDVVAGDEQWFIDEAERTQVKIAFVIDTHIHADHLSGGRALAERVSAPYCLHESNQGHARFAFHALHDGDLLEAGNVKTEVLHTPGHTPDSVSLLVTDVRRGPEPWFVLTGDTLLVGSVGRPDLGGTPEELAGTIYDSLHRKLLTLPDLVELYPGHTSGSACGAAISGKPASTLGFEKRFNPLLALADRQAFIAELTRDLAPKPANMERIVAANLGIAS